MDIYLPIAGQSVNALFMVALGFLGGVPDHRRQRVGSDGPHAPRRRRPEDGWGDDRRRAVRVVHRRGAFPAAPVDRPDRPRHRLPLRPHPQLDRRPHVQGRAARARLCQGEGRDRGQATAAQSLDRLAAAALALLQLRPLPLAAGAARARLPRRSADGPARHRRRVHPRPRDDLFARHGAARGDRHESRHDPRRQRGNDDGPRADDPRSRYRARRFAPDWRRGRCAVRRNADDPGQARLSPPRARRDHSRGRHADGARPRLAARRNLFDRAAVKRRLSAVLLALAPLLIAADKPLLVPDISARKVQIRYSFTGAQLLLFGAIIYPGGRTPSRPADIVVVLRGPVQPILVREKRKIAGIWMNADSNRFRSAPSFYAVASSRPIADLMDERTAAIYELGLHNLQLSPGGGALPEKERRFEAGLLDLRRKHGLYYEDSHGVEINGGVLYRATLTIPSQVPVGTYTAETFLIDRGKVIAAATKDIQISKSGFERFVALAARRHEGLYGLVAVLMSLGMGWAAAAFFRRRM